MITEFTDKFTKIEELLGQARGIIGEHNDAGRFDLDEYETLLDNANMDIGTCIEEINRLKSEILQNMEKIETLTESWNDADGNFKELVGKADTIIGEIGVYAHQ